MSVTGSPPVRFPAGMSNSPRGYVFGEYPARTPPRVNQAFTDFNTYAAADWTVVTSGAGGTSALIDRNGGALQLTTGAVLGDMQGQQAAKRSFSFNTGNEFWFLANLTTSPLIDNTALVGVTDVINTTLVPTNGVFFNTVAGSALVQAIIRTGGVSTVIDIGTTVTNRFGIVGFYYDGKPTPSLYFYSSIGLTFPSAFTNPYFNGTSQAVAVASAFPGSLFSLVNLPNVVLAPGFGIKSGVTAAQTMTLDYLFCANEVNRF